MQNTLSLIDLIIFHKYKQVFFNKTFTEFKNYRGNNPPLLCLWPSAIQETMGRFFFLINLIKHCGVGFFAMQAQGLNTRVIQICMAGILSASYNSDHLSSCVIVFLFFFFNLKSKKKKVKLILTIYIPIYCILLYILYITIDTQYFYIYSFSGYIEQIISRLKISFLTNFIFQFSKLKTNCMISPFLFVPTFPIYLTCLVSNLWILYHFCDICIYFIFI